MNVEHSTVRLLHMKFKQARRAKPCKHQPRDWIECIFAHVSSVICETNTPLAFPCKLGGLNTPDNSPSYIYAS